MSQAQPYPLVRLLHRPATAWTVLLAAFALTAAAWYVADKSVRQAAHSRFHYQANEIRAAIDQRMVEYESALRGGLALFKSSSEVTRKEWHSYATTLQLQRYYPGIQGFGYSEMVRPEARARHEQAIRAQGFPDYHIKPEGERSLYSSIIYLEPFDVRNQRAFGYDMYSEPTRHEAMDRARDTGQAAASGRVTLVQEMNTDIQHGFLMYLPLYRRDMPTGTIEQRRAALQGYVYAPFRMNDLMQGILTSTQRDIDFELYDGTRPAADNILYQSRPGPLHFGTPDFDESFSMLEQIELGGRTWSFHAFAQPGFITRAEASQPLFVAIGGVLIDLLLFLIIRSIAQRQRQAESLARVMTEDLRRSNADLEQFAYAASHDMRQPLRMVSSYLQLLEEDLRPHMNEDTRQNLHFAIEGAQRMDDMLAALLDYSRIGRKTGTRMTLDSRAALNEALRYLQPDIAAAGADVSIEGEWPEVFANRDEMVRLFLNLIGNALKYRQEAILPKVHIVSSVNGDEWHFSVRDNGVGLPPGHVTRLFKVFERLHSRERFPGTGIGLALCRKIVEHHGGHIWAESAGVNRGCTFHVVIPRIPQWDSSIAGQMTTKGNKPS